MAFCANCGAALNPGSGFCGNCGKPAGAATQPSRAAVAPGSAAAPSGSTGISANVAGALAYVLGLITGVIFLVLEPYKSDRFVRFHAMQSVLFSVACLALSVAWSVVTGILGGSIGILALLTLPLQMLLSLGIFILWLYVMYQAYNNREYRIPLIGAIAAQQLG
jgi:uncharacterized membrane protein